MSEKVLVVLSGGLDSTIALHLTRAEHDVEAISFYYGQKQKVELERAKQTCDNYGIKWHLVDITFLGDMVKGVCANISGSDISVPDIKDVLGDPQPVTYVPNRNMILMSIAASLAESIGASKIVCGLQSHDQYGYWDTTSSFVESLNHVLEQNRMNKIEIVAPFVNLSKKDEIGHLVTEYGVTDSLEMLKSTLTCYDPIDGKSCGHCPSCSERLKAFSDLGLTDPIEYQ